MKILRLLLFPFALLYGMIISVRNLLYDKQVLESTEFKLPVIVVGNLSTGGTGKTPMVEYLVELLSSSFKVAVLSRGYRRKSKGYILADENATVDTIGDEPYQFLKKFDSIQVAVAENRRLGIDQLLGNANPPEVIVLDDAFQHRSVRTKCNVLLTSYDALYAKDFLLPTGNLREWSSGSRRAQCIVVTKCPTYLSAEEQQRVLKSLKPTSNQQVFFTKIGYSDHIEGVATIAVADLRDYEVLLLTGIANPRPLQEYLNTKKINFTHHDFPDHHDFSDADINKIKEVFGAFESNKRIILTTEKDYVRIFGRLSNLYYLPIKTEFLDSGQQFDKLILNYVE